MLIPVFYDTKIITKDFFFFHNVVNSLTFWHPTNLPHKYSSQISLWSKSHCLHDFPHYLQWCHHILCQSIQGAGQTLKSDVYWAGLDELNVKELISESVLIWGIMKSNLQFCVFFFQRSIYWGSNKSFNIICLQQSLASV